MSKGFLAKTRIMFVGTQEPAREPAAKGGDLAVTKFAPLGPPPLPKRRPLQDVPSDMAKTQYGPVEDVLVEVARRYSDPASEEATHRLRRGKPVPPVATRRSSLRVVAGVLAVVALALTVTAASRTLHARASTAPEQRQPTAAASTRPASSGVASQPGAVVATRSAARAEPPQPRAVEPKSAEARSARLSAQGGPQSTVARPAAPLADTRQPAAVSGEASASSRPKAQTRPAAVEPPTPKAARTSGREAAEALAAGDLERATDLYTRLAQQNPEVPAYAAAARILAERIGRSGR